MYVVDKQNTPAQALSLVMNILDKMPALSKPRRSFMQWLFGAWLGLPVRHSMLNLARFGPYCDRSVRLHFEKTFDFDEFNQQVIDSNCVPERIAAFDPCFISRSGRKTFGLDEFWCGTRQKMERGLEVGVLSVIDVQARTAFSLRATQTPGMKELKAKDKNLMDHYIGQIEKQKQPLKKLGVQYIAADAYFAKQSMVDQAIHGGCGHRERLSSHHPTAEGCRPVLPVQWPAGQDRSTQNLR
jgi:hypothetical protein